MLIKNVKESEGGIGGQSCCFPSYCFSSFSIFSLHLQTDASLFFPSAPIRNKSRREKKRGKKHTERDTLWMPTLEWVLLFLLHLKTLLLFFQLFSCLSAAFSPSTVKRKGTRRTAFYKQDFCRRRRREREKKESEWPGAGKEVEDQYNEYTHTHTQAAGTHMVRSAAPVRKTLQHDA